VYSGAGANVRALDPHIYALAEHAHHEMRECERSQTIIVTGESGAGKTVCACELKFALHSRLQVSAKYTLRYITSVGGRGHVKRNASEQSSIEDMVLASNPILEVCCIFNEN
jgi:myosin heavy subunit